ncbi:uncharacterized protein LOC142984618 [Anticarsia gemmatalis]|uniref:uncharacterized protein LOC142984618 n=1 Tax=Anticarsia gemmatalis TaxID=129554 RepID=UPI003F7658B1
MGMGYGPYGPAMAANAFAAPFAAAAAPVMAFDAPCGAMYGYDGLAYANAIDGIEFTATSGGALPVSSASAVAPTGLMVASESVYEGPLAAAGELPFVGTVAVEGVLPTAGAGAVNHACGNGINAMAAETTAFAPGYAAAAYAPAAALAPFGAAGIAPFGAAGIAPAAAGFGYPARFAGRGFGCAL